MADASDSKSDEGDFVWVQVPSPALLENKGFLKNPPEKCPEDFFVLTSILTSTSSEPAFFRYTSIAKNLLFAKFFHNFLYFIFGKWNELSYRKYKIIFTIIFISISPFLIFQ